MAELTKSFIDKQRATLLELRAQIMNKLKEKPEGIHETAEDMKEEGDHAQVLLNQQMSFSLRDRELARLREIDAALYRIDEGTYGMCEESGEPIEKKRLEKQPWAKYTIYYAEQMERESRNFRSSM
jgi:DnaK suppressor protein